MKRKQSFDIMKGIGIIAMIVGHICSPEVGRYIYLWHMPLFFLISGYFFREKGMKDCLKSNTKSLLIPYMLTAILLTLFKIALVFSGHDGSVTNALLSIFVGAESIQNSCFSDYQIGAIWFLLALFWCRTIFNYLSTRYSRGGIFAISIIATYLGTKIFIPTNLLQGLSAMTFFMIGDEVKKRDLLVKKTTPTIWILGSFTIILSATTSSISMATCDYGYYPVNVLGAVFATYFIYHFSLTIAKYKISIVLSFWGRISLLILCIHLLDIKLGFASAISKRIFVDFAFADCFNVCLHIAIPLLLSAMLYKCGLIRNIFQLK